MYHVRHRPPAIASRSAAAQSTYICITSRSGSAVASLSVPCASFCCLFLSSLVIFYCPLLCQFIAEGAVGVARGCDGFLHLHFAVRVLQDHGPPTIKPGTIRYPILILVMLFLCCMYIYDAVASCVCRRYGWINVCSEVFCVRVRAGVGVKVG